MKIVVYVHEKRPHQLKNMRAFIDTMKGADVEVVTDWIFRTADLFLFWSLTDEAEKLRVAQAGQKRNYLIFDEPFIGDEGCVYMGLNGYHGAAKYPAVVDVDARAKLLGCELRPWVTDEADGDGNIIRKTATKLKAFFKSKKIVILSGRRHVSRGDLNYAAFISKVQDVGAVAFAVEPIKNYLKSARVVVTTKSPDAVSAVLAGVPVVALDPLAMVYDVAGHDEGALVDYVTPDRGKWFARVLGSHWTGDEVADGSAWKAIKAMVGVKK